MLGKKWKPNYATAPTENMRPVREEETNIGDDEVAVEHKKKKKKKSQQLSTKGTVTRSKSTFLLGLTPVH